MMNLHSSKVGNAISDKQKRLRGYIQGCSWSLDAALAIMTVWSKVMKEEANVTASSFADDNNFMASGENHIQKTMKAWELPLEFDKIAGTELNDKKSNFYANNDKEEEKLRLALTPWPAVNVVKHFKLVGGIMLIK